MRTNRARERTRYTSPPFTYEGGRADAHMTPLTELRRLVSTCMLWEPTFYEKGHDIVDRIKYLCDGRIDMQDVANLAITARNDLKLRHVPLFLVTQLTRSRTGLEHVARTLEAVVKRPDEVCEFIKLYWAHGKRSKKMLPRQVKLGLERAFQSFNEYQLAKWDRESEIKLRDAMFLVHPKPKDERQERMWRRFVDGKLDIPDTWEVGLSEAKTPSEKREVWERLLADGNLGYMALLMNLRNMNSVGVNKTFINDAILRGAKKSWALPFRFITAAKHAPDHADALSEAMLESVSTFPKLYGKTVLLVDISPSMDDPLSGKADTKRDDAAGGLAILLREICDDVEIYTFSNGVAKVPNYHGLPLADAILRSQHRNGTYLATALQTIERITRELHRLIVITDEESHDGIHRNWARYGYLINVAPHRPGLETSYNNFVRINGWSESVVSWLMEFEREGGLHDERTQR